MQGTDKPPFEFLHDLENDPDQLTNLALDEKNAPALKRMRQRCDEMIAEVGPPMEDIKATQRSPRRKKPGNQRSR